MLPARTRGQSALQDSVFLSDAKNALERAEAASSNSSSRGPPLEQLSIGAREFKGGDAVAPDISVAADPNGSGTSMPAGSLSAETQTTSVFYFPVERIVDNGERLEKMGLDMIRLLRLELAWPLASEAVRVA